MNPALPRLVAAATALLGATPPVLGQVLGGTVVDSASGKPVAGAHLIVFNAAGAALDDAVTSSDGRFAFHLPSAGDYRLRAGRLGYATKKTQPIVVASTVETNVLLRLAQKAVSLESHAVIAEDVAVDKELQYLADAGFYRRRRMGFGHFLTRAEIESQYPLVMSDVLRGMPGVRVRCGSPLSCSIDMRAASTMFLRGKCQPSVVLDGFVLRVGGIGTPGDLGVDDLLDPSDIEAFEVYPGPAGVPVQYQGYVSPCGAIIAWSRR